MSWLTDLIYQPHASQSIFILCGVGALGMALARVKIAGVPVGIAGVLFAGLLAGNLGIHLRTEVTTFAKELGLLLFVYTVGLELGPGFLDSLKRQGLKLNALALIVIGGGIAVTLFLWKVLHLPLPLAAGLLTGATTNTPSLGAVQQALGQIPHISEEQLRQPTIGYVLAYPLAVVGIITSLVCIRVVLGIRVAEAAAQLQAEDQPTAPAILRRNLLVSHPGIQSLALRNIPGLESSGVIISRVYQNNKLLVATPDTLIGPGDVVLAVGVEPELQRLESVLGQRSELDLVAMKDSIVARRMVVTQGSVVGLSLGHLNLTQKHGVNVTRVQRGEIELQPIPSLALHMGDLLTIVGEDKDLVEVSNVLGNSPRALEHLETLPFFTGIAIGVLVGSIPLAIPGLPATVQLGLAGGPLLVGMALSHLSRIGPFVWYMPPNANKLLREAGIILFLACVGIHAGPGFTSSLLHGDGWLWMISGAAITLLPLALAAWIGHVWMKLNYLTLCGVLSGSMTDPPALAYTNTLSESNGPSVAYATVYPLAMMLRVIAAQCLILVGMS
jgi:putative transport protein